MLVEYTIQEAQLVATLLNQHKQQTEVTCSVASTALDKLVAASKEVSPGDEAEEEILAEPEDQ